MLKCSNCGKILTSGKYLEVGSKNLCFSCYSGKNVVTPTKDKSLSDPFADQDSDDIVWKSGFIDYRKSGKTIFWEKIGIFSLVYVIWVVLIRFPQYGSRYLKNIFIPIGIISLLSILYYYFSDVAGTKSWLLYEQGLIIDNIRYPWRHIKSIKKTHYFRSRKDKWLHFFEREHQYIIETRDGNNINLWISDESLENFKSIEECKRRLVS